MYYIFIENGKLNGAGQCPILNPETENFAVSEDVYNAYIENPEKYIYSDGEIIENPDYEAEQARKERERLDMLSLTAADVERAIYKDKGMDFEDIIALLEAKQSEAKTQNEQTAIRCKDAKSLSVSEADVNSYASMPLSLYASEIDVKALKIELKANNFYRGNPYVNAVGALLGYTVEELDYLFENKVLPEHIDVEVSDLSE